VVNALLAFLFWVVAARFYSAVDVGLVAALTSASGLMAMLASLGLPTGLLRFLPGSTDKRRIVNSAFTASMIASLVASGIFVAGTSLWSPELVFLQEQAELSALFALVTIGTALSYTQSPAFIALRRPGLAFIHVAVCALLRIPAAIALAKFGMVGLWGSWAIFLGLNLLLFAVLFRLAEPGYFPSPALNVRVLKEILPFSVGNLGADVPYYAAVSVIPLMVLNILGPESTAYYYVAFRVGSAVLTIATFVGMSLLVEGSYDPGKLRQNVLRATRFSFLLLVPALLVIFLLGDKLLSLFGGDYSEQALIVVWLISAASLPHIVTEFFISVRRVQLRVKAVVLVAWAILILNIAFAWPSIVHLGLAGSGLGWLASYSAVAATIMALMGGRRLARRRTANRTQNPRA
jgi:O-antigen/teichoic acid export membrane protein